MSTIGDYVGELVDFGMRFPLFAIAGILVLVAILAIFFNINLAIGAISFAVVMFLAQIMLNKSG